jgi:uncharacterized protein YgbK (DUF1537 family)
VPGAAREPLVVLDDDPTGVQTLAGIRVLLAWDPARVHAALEGRQSIHLITNSRALPAARVRTFVAAAARASLDGVPDAGIVLRGDSTLRGHVLEEYLGVRDVVNPSGWPVLLLVPALPSAGRITVGGVHLFDRDGRRTPLQETEYARDGVFAYASARLLEWAHERSGGLFRAGAGRELHLDELRSRGPAAVTEALLALAAMGDPAVFAPDAETVEDLDLVAEGYRAATADGGSVIVRCAPTFAGVLAGTTASALVPPPVTRNDVLVVCGSYVPQSTRQVSELLDARPGSLVEADVLALASDDPSAEIAQLAAEVSRRLAANRLAVLATPRERPVGTTTLEAGERIAAGLARVVATVHPSPSLIVAKGGITAAVTLRDGVGAAEADVVGPVEPGVSLWSARWPDGSVLDYVVVPGNVGDHELLARLVATVTGSAAC